MFFNDLNSIVPNLLILSFEILQDVAYHFHGPAVAEHPVYFGFPAYPFVPVWYRLQTAPFSRGQMPQPDFTVLYEHTHALVACRGTDTGSLAAHDRSESDT